MKSPNNHVAGGGYFVKFTRLPLSLAWEVLGSKNGAAYREAFEALQAATQVPGWRAWRGEADEESTLTIFAQKRYTKHMASKRKRALSLPSSVVATAETLARTERRSVEAIVSTALRTYAKTKGGQRNGTRTRASQRTGKDLWETIVGPFEDLPVSVLRKLPRDAALKHDRYIYGRRES